MAAGPRPGLDPCCLPLACPGGQGFPAPGPGPGDTRQAVCGDGLSCPGGAGPGCCCSCGWRPGTLLSPLVPRMAPHGEPQLAQAWTVGETAGAGPRPGAPGPLGKPTPPGWSARASLQVPTRTRQLSGHLSSCRDSRARMCPALQRGVARVGCCHPHETDGSWGRGACPGSLLRVEAVPAEGQPQARPV